MELEKKGTCPMTGTVEGSRMSDLTPGTVRAQGLLRKEHSG